MMLSRMLHLHLVCIADVTFDVHNIRKSGGSPLRISELVVLATLLVLVMRFHLVNLLMTGSNTALASEDAYSFLPSPSESSVYQKDL